MPVRLTSPSVRHQFSPSEVFLPPRNRTTRYCKFWERQENQFLFRGVRTKAACRTPRQSDDYLSSLRLPPSGSANMVSDCCVNITLPQRHGQNVLCMTESVPLDAVPTGSQNPPASMALRSLPRSTLIFKISTSILPAS